MSWTDFLTHPARRTQTRADTRDPIEEILHNGGSIQEALPSSVGVRMNTGAPTRRTFPMSDAASEEALKSRMDVANRARKITLYQTMLGESWISACVEAIAARMISGGWTLNPSNPTHPNQATRDAPLEFFNWVNQLEDLSELLHDSATDLLWAGEFYLEVTEKAHPGLGRSVPYELFTVDCISMDYRLSDDRKTIGSYVQTTDTGESIILDPRNIIRVWFPDPRNKLRALSPIEKLMNPATWDTYLQLSEQKYFEQGNRGDLAVALKSGDEHLAARYVKWFRERFLGVKNSHLPLITWGETSITNVGNRAQLDVLGRRKFARDEILAVYKVPPHLVSVVETGGLGSGGQSDTLEKQFIHTAVDPVRQRILAPLNFRLMVQGFGVTDWVLDTKYADMRDTKEIEEVRDLQVKGGRKTINQIRQENGDEPIEGGDVAYIWQPQALTPVADLEHMASPQRLETATTTGGTTDDPSKLETAVKNKAAQDKQQAAQIAAQQPAQMAPGQPGRQGAAQSQKAPVAAQNAKSKAARESVIDPEIDQELAAWERVCLKRLREGRKLKAWRSDVLPGELVETLNAELAEAADVATVERAFHHTRAVFEEAAGEEMPDWLAAHLATARADLDAWNADFAEQIVRGLLKRSAA